MNSAPDVQSYLTSEFGPIQTTFHYSLPGNKRKQGGGSGSGGLTPHGAAVHWILAEFSKKQDFDKAVQSCQNAVGTLPFVSSMCWFSHNRVGGKSGSSSVNSKVSTETLAKSPEGIDFSKAKTVRLNLHYLPENYVRQINKLFIFELLLYQCDIWLSKVHKP